MIQHSLAEKEKNIFLNYTDCQKVHCGLRWDPPDEEMAVNTDLDLVYVVFDQYGDFISAVSGKDNIKIGEAGAFYHSGDDTEGVDDHDDERVTLNLFSMPRHIKYIFLAVEIGSNHRFGAVKNPEIRISKDLSHDDILRVDLTERKGEDSKAFVFVRLARKEGGWDLSYIGDYIPEGEIPDWSEYLMKFLPAPVDSAGRAVGRPVVPAKGEKVPLFYTKESRHRVICGLSWDARGEKRTVMDKLKEMDGSNITTFDLDLSCILFDADGEYYDYVTTDRAIDESGAVYHTGDDTTGAGEGDDEQVSVELLKLPEDVYHVVFVVEAKSKHALGEVYNPEVRVADGMSNRTQLKIDLSEGGDNNACIFARLTRGAENWELHYIGEYVHTEDVEDWVTPLQPYLD